MRKKWLPLVLVVGIFLVLSGCAIFKKKKEVVKVQQPPPKKVEKVEQKPKPKPKPKVVTRPTLTPMQEYEIRYSKLPTSHTVVKGECLWWIAEYKNVYNDPFMWPLIYKANRDKIKNPNLIYPGQVFEIPRDFSLDYLKECRRSAGAPRPYLPPEDANLPAKLRAELGWGF